MMYIMNPGETYGVVLDTTKDISILVMAPARPGYALDDTLLTFLREAGFDSKRLASVHYLSHEPLLEGKAECKLSVMKQGWERVKAELALVPDVTRLLFIGTTKSLRVLVPKLAGDMQDAHGTLFSVNVGGAHTERKIVLVPTFHQKDWKLLHVQPWMKRDIQRLMTLKRPDQPLEYTTSLPMNKELWKTLVIDIETDSLDPQTGKITHLGLQWSAEDRAIISDSDHISDTLMRIAVARPHVWFHNAQFDISWFGEQWIRRMYGHIHCTMMRGKARGELVNSLKHLGNTFTARPGNYAWHVPGESHEYGNPAYICEDLDVTWRLVKLFHKTTPVIELAERVLVMNAVQTMHGSMVDMQLLEQIVEQNQHAIAEMREELTAEYGCDPNQIDVLVEALRSRGYQFAKKTKTGKDALTAEVLEENGLIQILDYRRAQKLDSSFVGKIKALMRPDGTVPHHQSLLNAKSGRSTMSDINHQQFPRKGPSKKLIVSRFNGGCIIQVDLAQAELRVACYEADDEVMAHWLNTSKDAHRDNAAEAFGVAFDDVTPEQRQDSKTLIFRSLYGGKPVNESQKRVERFLIGKYRKLYAYLKASKQLAMENNCTVDRFGKVCNLVDTYDYRGRWGVGRSGVNAPIQGIASHISQYITVRLWELFYEHKCKSLVLYGVHDSTIIDCYPGEEDKVLQLIGQAFEWVGQLLVEFYKLASVLPMLGEVLKGPNWGDTKACKPVIVSSHGGNPCSWT